MSTPPPVRSITIIGGGFAGAVAAIKLLDQAASRLEITLVESRSSVGRGLAYGTPDPNHLVNGPARIFGLHPERPDHLVDWLRAHGAAEGWSLPADLPDASPPRWLYGTYVQSELRRAVAEARGRSSLRIVTDRAAALVREAGGLVVRTAAGHLVRSGAVVLATGVFQAAPTSEERALAEMGLYLPNPWDAAAFDGLADADSLLLIGSSLSMVDAVASLEARGYRGRYTVVSRRGQVVDARQAGPVEAWRDFLGAAPLPRSARALLGRVKAERRAIAAAGIDWQGLPLSIKPHLKTLWHGASDRERLRFARHLRSFWDVTAHRAAPESYAAVARARAEGRLVTRAGRVLAMTAAGPGVEIAWRMRGASTVDHLLVDAVINCRGHQLHDWRRIDDPFIRGLLADGLVRPHSTGFGIAATEAGEVLDGRGRVQPDLLAIGHPLRGVSWESSSIGEQLAQAIALAQHLTVRQFESA